MSGHKLPAWRYWHSQHWHVGWNAHEIALPALFHWNKFSFNLVIFIFEFGHRRKQK